MSLSRIYSNPTHPPVLLNVAGSILVWRQLVVVYWRLPGILVVVRSWWRMGMRLTVARGMGRIS